MKREITWTLGTGNQATVTVELVLSESICPDGVAVEVPCCEIKVVGQVPAVGLYEIGQPRPVTHPVAVAAIGKLAFAQTVLDQINAAIAECEATPEWQAKLAGIEQARKDQADYDAHRAKMRRVMGY